MRHCRLRGSPPPYSRPWALPALRDAACPSSRGERVREERRVDRRVSQSRRRWTRSCALIKYYVRLTECRARKRRRSPCICPSFDRPLGSSLPRIFVFVSSSVDRSMATVAGVVVEWPSDLFSFRFKYRLSYDNKETRDVKSFRFY